MNLRHSLCGIITQANLNKLKLILKKRGNEYEAHRAKMAKVTGY